MKKVGNAYELATQADEYTVTHGRTRTGPNCLNTLEGTTVNLNRRENRQVTGQNRITLQINQEDHGKSKFCLKNEKKLIKPRE